MKSRLLALLVGVLGVAQPCYQLPSGAQAAERAIVSTAKQGSVQEETKAQASKLIQAFYAGLSATGSPTGSIGKPKMDDSEAVRKVKMLLDQDVIVQRADGDYFDFFTYQPMDIDQYAISNVNATRPREDLIVATYSVSTPGATSLTRGTVSSGDFMPRLTTFRFNPKLKEWQILSHAVFSQPMKQICDHPPIHSAPIPQRQGANRSREKLVNSLIENLYKDVQLQGKAVEHQGSLITKNTEIVSADGYARTGATRARSVKFNSTQKRGFYVTGSGNDLVVRFEVKNNSQIGGVEFTHDWEPRLATFSKNQSGQWELVSFALFNFPVAPPKNLQCINKN